MNLYFVAHVTEDGNNADWFFAANDRDEAVALWLKTMRVWHSHDFDENPDNVFIVPVKIDVSKPMALDWFKEVVEA